MQQDQRAMTQNDWPRRSYGMSWPRKGPALKDRDTLDLRPLWRSERKCVGVYVPIQSTWHRITAIHGRIKWLSSWTSFSSV